MLDVAPHERLAAGQAQLLDAGGREDARKPLDLLERQQLVAREEAVVAPVDLARHAVDAAEVAPVGDRDAEVAERSAERVQHARNVARPRFAPGAGRNNPWSRQGSLRRHSRRSRTEEETIVENRDQVEGTLKETEGKLTDDEVREGQGKAEKAWGDLKEKAEDVKEEIDERT